MTVLLESLTVLLLTQKLFMLMLTLQNLGKVRDPDVPIVGDCRLVIEELIQATARNSLLRIATG
jgi:thiamine pyrophosphate-dependent acetolactate synthase large subunit-like protein